MHIESIEKYKGSTMQIEFSDGQTAFINSQTVQRFELRAPMDIPESGWQQVVYEDTRRRARERAMYLLDYRDHSYVELFRKLRKSYEEDICYEVADELAEKGFINDMRYAENIARRLFEVKLCGEFKARAYMRERGIPRAVAEAAIEPYLEESARRAARLIEKKYLKYLEPKDRAMMQKLKNALAGQGYRYADINAAIELICAEYEDDGDYYE